MSGDATALYRVRLPDGTTRLARGPVATGPVELLARTVTLDGLLAEGGASLADACRGAVGAGRIPQRVHVLAPVQSQEVWAAGVTYERSREERKLESTSASVYDLVYEAARPELFLKAPGWRVQGPGEPIGIRADSAWNVPEPELALVVSAAGDIVGYSIGDDVSSRSIEGENPLYLPQAKVYDRACAIGPAIVPVGSVPWPLRISLVVERDGAPVVDEATDTSMLRRTPAELVAYATRALSFPTGFFLLTGTGIVPRPEFTLAPGDLVRIGIEGLGELANEVVVVGRHDERPARARS